MKHLHIQSDNYKYLEQGFKEWLDILGFAQRTINRSPFEVREMLHYFEQRNINHITAVKPRVVYDFFNYLKSRPAYRCNTFSGVITKAGGGLSTSSFNGYVTSVNLFARYLNQTHKHVLDVSPKRLESFIDERTILSKQEIKQIYESTYEPHSTFNSQAMGQRDRAIIAIFYGCGLRKDEGSRLDLSDIDLLKRLVFVRKAKGNKQRYVPIAEKHCQDIRNYIEQGRYWFLEDHYSSTSIKQGKKKQNADKEAFFLGVGGKRMKSFYARLDYMQQRSGIEKHFSTHTLRHSIATHLLQSGMPMEEIARFLGHSSLESTQIYTHIVKQLEQEEYELTEF